MIDSGLPHPASENRDQDVAVLFAGLDYNFIFGIDCIGEEDIRHDAKRLQTKKSGTRQKRSRAGFLAPRDY